MRLLQGEEADRIKQKALWKTKSVCNGKGWTQSIGRIPCGNAFEIDELDIQSRTYMDYGGGTDTYYGFTCPNCGCFTELDIDKIPSYVKSSSKRYVEPSSDNSDK